MQLYIWKNPAKLLAVSILALLIVSFQNCGRFSSDKATDNQSPPPSELNSPEEYFTNFGNLGPGLPLDKSQFTNVVYTKFLNAKELLLATANYREGKFFFQISLSLDGGQTSYNFPQDPFTSLVPNFNVSPQGMALSSKQLLVFAVGKKEGDSSTKKTAIFHTSTSELDWKIVTNEKIDGCYFENGKLINGKWILLGYCNEQWSVFEADANLTNFKVLDQLPEKGGGTLDILIASDRCWYVGGYNSSYVSGQAQGVALVRKSCDSGLTWTQEFSYVSPKYHSFVNLIEINAQIYATGERFDPETSKQEAVFWTRVSANNWKMKQLEIEHAMYSEPLPIYLGAVDSCHFVVVFDVSSDFEVQESRDCGQNWALKQRYELDYIRGASIFGNILYLGSAYDALKLQTLKIE